MIELTATTRFDMIQMMAIYISDVYTRLNTAGRPTNYNGFYATIGSPIHSILADLKHNLKNMFNEEFAPETKTTIKDDDGLLHQWEAVYMILRKLNRDSIMSEGDMIAMRIRTALDGINNMILYMGAKLNNNWV